MFLCRVHGECRTPDARTGPVLGHVAVSDALSPSLPCACCGHALARLAPSRRAVPMWVDRCVLPWLLAGILVAHWEAGSSGVCALPVFAFVPCVPVVPGPR